MTIEHPGSSSSTPLSDHQEYASMNLIALANLETQERQAQIRHDLEERTLERAAGRRRRRLAGAAAGRTPLLSRFIGWLAPRRVATASGAPAQPVTLRPPSAEGHNECGHAGDCANTSANRATS